MACSKLVFFFLFFKLNRRKIFDYKEIFFLFYVFDHPVYKITLFYGKVIKICLPNSETLLEEALLIDFPL